ncbi:MAG: patatin-like phospholipase family protein [Allorhizobium sp.]
MRLVFRAAAATLFGIALVGCVAGNIGPINVFTPVVGQASPEFVPDPGDDGSTMVGLAFSGGGTRAAAFAYGVLRELDEIVVDEYPYRRTLVDDIRMISGTSGGSVAAAYFGYKGKDDYRDFRERFLVQDVEASMRTSKLSPVNIARLLNGGVNDRSSFARWLDQKLFDGATFASFKGPDAPIVWINASDVYNRTPFLFTYDTFAALCSDLDKVKLSDAVAASAAVPAIFTPILLDADAPDCGYRRPEWLTRALSESRVSLRLEAYARALDSYRNADRLRYVKLLDGGLTDNIGITGFALERASAKTPYGPLSADEAVKLRTLLFIVADAGRKADPAWGGTKRGPNLSELIPAVADTSISSSVRDGYDALDLAVAQWRGELIRYRCGLSSAEVLRHRGTLKGWNCRDVRIVLEHLSFRDADPSLAAQLNGVPTRLTLPVGQVDMVIKAGREAVRSKTSIRDAVTSIQRYAGLRVRTW